MRTFHRSRLVRRILADRRPSSSTADVGRIADASAALINAKRPLFVGAAIAEDQCRAPTPRHARGGHAAAARPRPPAPRGRGALTGANVLSPERFVYSFAVPKVSIMNSALCMCVSTKSQNSKLAGLQRSPVRCPPFWKGIGFDGELVGGEWATGTLTR
ncbi:hypothetical protein EVAR_79251_1 [Eumeta japonica]|uniref:Uncharacterized protein n=1 Tax=Eumeta variegata TaxID=151549 RepID=A0A4C1TEL0_EUMVA|nr:hypothetical protein EVAR_79251_1 [Eumeta japonica]